MQGRCRLQIPPPRSGQSRKADQGPSRGKGALWLSAHSCPVAERGMADQPHKDTTDLSGSGPAIAQQDARGQGKAAGRPSSGNGGQRLLVNGLPIRPVVRWPRGLGSVNHRQLHPPVSGARHLLELTRQRRSRYVGAHHNPIWAAKAHQGRSRSRVHLEGFRPVALPARFYVGLQSPRQANRQCLCGAVQRSDQGRVPRRKLVLEPSRCSA